MITTIPWKATQAQPNAFPERQALMPVWEGEAIPQAEWQQCWQQAAINVLKEDGLAYFHIPFCASHCIFCGFYRNAWKEDYSKVYTDKLIEELAYEASIRQGNGKIQAVYFGGGTPTALATEDLVRLIKACYQYLPLATDCEFTLEGRISHFDIEKARACVEAGVNRISIGVQTFNSAIRKRLGRKHSGEEAYAYLQALCELDAVIVADLIFGLPNQTDEVWANDINVASGLPLSGLDIYAFNNYPFLPINKMIEHDTLPPAASFEVQAQHYAYAVENLQQAGWTQVSNNHFAFPGRGERNRYNTLVKSNMPCLAFGSGAGGNFSGYSFQVDTTLQTYLDTPADKKALSYLSKQGPNKQLLGIVQHDLELGYLDIKLFRDNPKAMKLLMQWQQLSLLNIDANGIACLNISGRYWSPTLIRKLMLTLPTHDEKEHKMVKLSEQQLAELRQSLAENPGQILEMVAGMKQCSFEEVISCLPQEMITKTDGSRFVEIMQALATLEDAVTFIAHTADAIVEVTGKLPSGQIGRGFYNFDHTHEGGVHGHLRYENCAAIYLLERPFMGKHTVSLNFVNHQGGAMFKIFVGRDAERNLRQNQIDFMRQLIKG